MRGNASHSSGPQRGPASNMHKCPILCQPIGPSHLPFSAPVFGLHRYHFSRHRWKEQHSFVSYWAVVLVTPRAALQFLSASSSSMKRL